MTFFFKNKLGDREEIIPTGFSDVPEFIICHTVLNPQKQLSVHAGVIETVYDARDIEEQKRKLVNALIDNGS